MGDRWLVQPGQGTVQVDVVAGLSPWDAASLAREVLAAATVTGSWKPCKYCPAPLVWAWTENNARMPLDIGDHPAGNMAARTENGKTIVRSLTRSSPDLRDGEHRVMSHYSTCIGAAKARADKAAKAGNKPGGPGRQVA